MATSLCVIDEAPVVAINEPKKGELFGGSELTLKGTVRDDGGDVTLELSIDGATWVPLEHSNGKFERPIALSEKDNAAFTLLVRAKDSKGTPATADVAVTVDNMAPRCTLSSPKEGSVSLSGKTALTWKVEDGAMLTAEASADGAMATMAQIAETTATWEWDVPANEDGKPHTVKFRAVDLAGNACEVESKFTVDNVKPTCAIVSPADGAVITAEGPVELKFTAADGATFTADYATAAGGPRVPLTFTNGAATATWQVPSQNGGVRAVSLRVTDPAGQTCEAVVNVTVDTVAPIIAIVSPTAGAKLGIAHFAASPVVSGIANDGANAIASVTLDLGDGSGPRTVPVTNGMWSAPWTPAAGTNYVEQTISAGVKDAVGHVAAATAKVMVDVVAPVASFSQSLNQVIGGGGPLFDVVGQMRDGDRQGAAMLVAMIDVGDGAGFRTTTQTGGSFVYTMTLPALDYVDRVFSARVTDEVGNLGTASVTAKIDTIAPQLVISAPANNAKFNIASFAASNDVSVVFTATDGDPAKTVQRSGSDVTSPLKISTSPTDNGKEYEVTLRAMDTAGNVSPSLTVIFFVDRVAPTVAFVAPTPNQLLGSTWFAGSNPLKGTASDGALVAPQLQVTVDTTDGLGSRPATLTGSSWSAPVTRPTADFVARTFTAKAVDAFGNEAQTSVNVRIDTVAPQLAITSPANNAKFNLTHFTAGQNAVQVGFTCTDGDPARKVHYGAVEATGTSIPIQTSSTDNPKLYPVTLTAIDTAGNQSSPASVTFSVDRVAPSVVSNVPAHLSRNVDNVVSFTFSEPVTGECSDLTSHAATWDVLNVTCTHAGLWKGGRFSVTPGPVADGHGNGLAAPSAVVFRTAPAMPASGQVLATGATGGFRVSADQDGVLSFMLRRQSGSGSVVWSWWALSELNASNSYGLFIDQPDANYADTWVNAWGREAADLSMSRRFGSSRRIAGSTNPFVVEDARVAFGDSVGDLAAMDTGYLMIPSQAFTAEGSNLGIFGRVVGNGTSGSLYRRTGRADVALSLVRPNMLGVSASRWEAVASRPSSIQVQSFVCYRPPAFVSTVCETMPVATLPDVAPAPKHSYAANESCSMHAYGSATSGARRMIAQTFNPTCALSQNCARAENGALPPGEEARVAADPAPGANKFVRAIRTSGGVQLQVTTGCNLNFVDVGLAMTNEWADEFEPVVLQGKPVLVYRAGTNLKVYVP